MTRKKHAKYTDSPGPGVAEGRVAGDTIGVDIQYPFQNFG